MAFIQPAKALFPDLQPLRLPSAARAGYCLTLLVDVPYYKPREVEIWFRPQNPQCPRVYVDGPAESPHRYGDGALCMWYPGDPEGLRWLFEDGFVALVGHVVAHLFREAWWRERDEWLGPEVGHEESASKVTDERLDGSRTA